jgi:hypothetical protein
VSETQVSQLCKIKGKERCFWRFHNQSKSEEFLTVADGLFYFYKGIQANLANVSELNSALSRLYNSGLPEVAIAFIAKHTIAQVTIEKQPPNPLFSPTDHSNN